MSVGDSVTTSKEVTTEMVSALLAAAPDQNEAARSAAAARAGEILRPTGAMARLDEVAVHMAAWLGTEAPAVEAPAAIIFAADHGVAADGVSAYPSDVTAAMLAAFEASKASVSALARVAGATVTAIDVGVGQPTGNLRIEPAMSPVRFAEAFEAGRTAVANADADLLIFGEMGIGNTTAAAAVTAAISGGETHCFVGRGTGVDDDALTRKREVVSEAVARISGITDPLEVLRQVGGAELVAIAGALTESRLRSIPVLLDGYIASTPALALHTIDQRATSNCLAGHRSKEPGHQLILDALGLEPLLSLDLRLGEASGAMAAVPLVKMACAVLTEVPTFSEWFDSAEG